VVRYGVLADIHGNLFALTAAIRQLKREGVDAWLCAGDLVGYGPQPNECVEAVAELGAVCVAGNHELILLGRLSDQRSGSLARHTIAWTRGVLRDDCWSFLAHLPTVAVAPSLVVAHGSLDNPEEYVVQDRQAARQLHMLESEYPTASLLILGHTHRPWIYHQRDGTMLPAMDGASLAPGRVLLNPGSVGQSRQRERTPLARFMLLDVERRQARTLSTAYDLAACRQALRQHHLPRDAIHLRPGRLARARRRARGLLWRRRRPPGGPYLGR
jgi:predicted phosphodiesterase